MSDELATEERYELTLKGPGITINKVIDSRTAGAIAQMTFAGVQAGSVLVDRQFAAQPSSPGQPLSLREYLQVSAPDRGIHTKILAVARFMRDHENQSDFTREDVRSRFRSAGEAQPANFHRDFQKAVRAGWIADDHQNRGRYYVTRAGDDHIDHMQTQGSSTAPLVPRRSRRKNRRSVPVVRVEQ